MDSPLSLSCIQKRIKSETRVNILLFGCSGVGKSCFLNSICTKENVSEVTLSRIARTREFDIETQCTMKYHQYNVGNNIRVFDTVGWTPGVNYVSREFEMMLLGRVSNDSVCTNLVPSEAVDDRIIDVVIFLLDGKDGVKDDIIKNMKPFVDKTREMKKKVCVVVTKMDEVVEFTSQVAKEQCSALVRGPKFRSYQRKIAPILRMRNIFAMINYTYLDTMENELIMLLKKPIMSFLLPKEEIMTTEPLSLTRGEKIVSLRYPQSHPQRYDINFTEHIHSQDPRGVVLSSQSFFHGIQLGDRIFRLFVIKSFVCSDRDIIGVIDDNCKIYFEGTIERKTEIQNSFLESFGPNRVSEYVFLSEDSKMFQNFDESVDYLLLDLKVSKLGKIYLKRKGFGMFQMMIENQNQMKKFIQYISFSDDQKRKVKELEERISVNDLSSNEQKTEIENLRTKYSNLEQKYEELKLSMIQDRTTNSESCKLRIQTLDDEINERIKQKIEEHLQEKERIDEEEKREKERVAEEEERVRKIEEEERLARLRELDYSKILNDEQIIELGKHLPGFGDYEWTRLMRGTEDGFEISTFHSKCDDAPESICIFKSQKGNIFGGYCPISWKGGSGIVCAPKAWVFKFNGNTITRVNACSSHGSNYNGVYLNTSYGPCWGNSYGLWCSGKRIDQGGTKYCYMTGSKSGYESEIYLNGGTQKTGFKAVEFEVFTR